MSKIKTVMGGKDKDDLLDFDIDAQGGGGYTLKGPDNSLLSSTNQTTLPVTLPTFQYEGWTWTVTINSNTGKDYSGSWSNNDASITGEEGTWSTGSGTDAEAATATP